MGGTLFLNGTVPKPETVRVITKVWISISEHILPYLHKQKDLQGKVVGQVLHLFTALRKKIALRF